MPLSNAERQKRWRERQKAKKQPVMDDTVTNVPLIGNPGVTEFGVTIGNHEHVAFVVTVPIHHARVARDVMKKIPHLVRALNDSSRQ
jgi:hypothetical protein